MEHYYELPMNIFVTDPSPTISAQVLPDKHVVKMPLESCQMLSIIFSHWYHNWGDDLLRKKMVYLTKHPKVPFVIIHVHNGLLQVCQILHG